jgi:hypothetical protein
MNQVGTWEQARAAYWHHSEIWDEEYGWQISLAGQGEDRCAWRIGDVVYKVGKRDSANRYDHATGEEARRRGYRWAPPASTLYEVPGRWGETVPVLAMPYLEGDGTEADAALESEMQAQAGPDRHGIAVDGTNYVVIGGQPVVIDCCTVRLSYAEGDSRHAA